MDQCLQELEGFIQFSKSKDQSAQSRKERLERFTALVNAYPETVPFFQMHFNPYQIFPLELVNGMESPTTFQALWEEIPHNLAQDHYLFKTQVPEGIFSLVNKQPFGLGRTLCSKVITVPPEMHCMTPIKAKLDSDESWETIYQTLDRESGWVALSLPRGMRSWITVVDNRTHIFVPWGRVPHKNVTFKMPYPDCNILSGVFYDCVLSLFDPQEQIFCTDFKEIQNYWLVAEEGSKWARVIVPIFRCDNITSDVYPEQVATTLGVPYNPKQEPEGAKLGLIPHICRDKITYTSGTNRDFLRIGGQDS